MANEPTVRGTAALIGFPGGITLTGFTRESQSDESTADIEYLRDENNNEAVAIVSNPGARVSVEGWSTTAPALKKGDTITIGAVPHIVEAWSVRYTSGATRFSITAYKPDAMTLEAGA